MSTDGFDWFTGLATVKAPCPPALLQPNGPQRFFESPNHTDFGVKVPRVLMHESLHMFQLAGSSWLQRLVAEEWGRVLTLERTGVAPPHGPLRTAFGRPQQGIPFSVRDLVECLARFWDMHMRGPDRVLEEEAFPDPKGEFAALRMARQARHEIPYTSQEYHAAMQASMLHDSYPRLYVQIFQAALDSPAVKSLGRNDPGRNANRASWAVNVLLPIAGFVALNTSDPVRAFVICLDKVLGDEEGLRLATAAENVNELIELDQLSCWAQLVEPLTRELSEANLLPRATLTGPMDVEGWREHPVWRHLPQRFDALTTGLTAMLIQPTPEPEPQRPWLPLLQTVLHSVLQKHAFAACGLMGIPPLRLQLGAAFAPPLLRFTDTQLCATDFAASIAPWPVTALELTAAVEDAQHRHRALRNADFAAKFGVKPGVFG